MSTATISLYVDNCPGCGSIYRKNPIHLCAACVAELERQYRVCEEFLRRNRKATLAELSDGTGISVAKITRFIKERRIYIEDRPNMGYACELCGSSIRSGKLCPTCYVKIQKDIVKTMKREPKKIELVSASLSSGAGYLIKGGVRTC